MNTKKLSPKYCSYLIRKVFLSIKLGVFDVNLNFAAFLRVLMRVCFDTEQSLTYRSTFEKTVGAPLELNLCTEKASGRFFTKLLIKIGSQRLVEVYFISKMGLGSLLCLFCRFLSNKSWKATQVNIRCSLTHLQLLFDSYCHWKISYQKVTTFRLKLQFLTKIFDKYPEKLTKSLSN